MLLCLQLIVDYRCTHDSLSQHYCIHILIHIAWVDSMLLCSSALCFGKTDSCKVGHGRAGDIFASDSFFFELHKCAGHCQGVSSKKMTSLDELTDYTQNHNIIIFDFFRTSHYMASLTWNIDRETLTNVFCDLVRFSSGCERF